MQQALTWSAGQASGAVPALPAGRRNKFVAGSIAALGASVIAITPVTSTSPALLEAQHRAVGLVATVTDSPSEVYQDLFNNTAGNLSYLASALQANPFPVLSTIIANQTGYAESMGTAVQAGVTQFQTWYETGTPSGELKTSGKTYLARAQAAFEAGDYAEAYNNINRIVLFGLMASLQPIYTEAFTIPPQMAQNFADAVTAVSNSGTLIFGLFQSVFSPVSGLAFEASNISEAISAAAQSGNPETVFNALVNTPGVLADAFLNGFDYNDTSGSANEVGSWAGLISHLVSTPNPNGGRDIVSSASGPLEQLLQTIPKKIAAAITNTPATADPAAKLLSSSAASETAAEVEVKETDISGTDPVTALNGLNSDAAKTLSISLPVTAAAETSAPAAADTEVTEAKPATSTTATTATKASQPAKTVSEGLKKLGDRISGKLKKPAKADATSGASETGASASEGSSTSAGKTAKKAAKKAAKSEKKSGSGSDS